MCQGNDPNSSTCSFFTLGWKWKACFPLQVWAGFWKHVAIWLITGQLIGPWQSTWHLALFLKRESIFDWVARMLKEEHSGNVCLAVFTSIGIDQSSQNYGLWVRSNAHANPFSPWTETCAKQLLPHLIALFVPQLCPLHICAQFPYRCSWLAQGLGEMRNEDKRLLRGTLSSGHAKETILACGSLQVGQIRSQRVGRDQW